MSPPQANALLFDDWPADIDTWWKNVARGGMLKKHVIAISVVLVSAITCGATFLLALYRQFALVEVAASLATGVQRIY